MYRFHNFINNNTPSFWKNYYKHNDFIKVNSYINDVLANKGTGFPLLQAYDIMNIRDHLPGKVITWEELKVSSYRYNKKHEFPHSYMLPANILDIMVLHDSITDPTFTYEKDIDFIIEESADGIIRFKQDLPVESLYVAEGILEAINVQVEDGVALKIELINTYQYDEYAYEYRVSGHQGQPWLLINSFIYRPQTKDEQIYTHTKDFIYDALTGIMKTKNKLYTIPVWIAKGTIVSNRLDSEYGQFLGFRRLDSKYYRDALQVMNSYFFLGPTYTNLVAAVNQVFKLPVAKYGDEEVIWATDKYVVTNKYRYEMKGNSHTFKNGGDLKYNQPLSDAVEFYDYSTHGNWWEDRVPAMFQKYAVATLTSSQKNRMMDTFLKYYVSHVRVNTSKLSTYQMSFLNDIWEMVLDGLPIRSDLILSLYTTIEDIDDPYDGVMMPEDMLTKIGLRMETLWQAYKESEETDEVWWANENIDFTLALDDLAPTDWMIGDEHYTILDKDAYFHQKMRKGKWTPPLLEPHYSATAMFIVENTRLPVTSFVVRDYNMPVIEFDNVVIYPGISDNFEDDIFGGESIHNVITDSFEIKTLFSEITYDKQRFKKWTMDNLLISEDGLIPPLGMGGAATSTPFVIGNIPKTLTISYGANIPALTTVTVYYTMDAGNTYTLVTPGSVLAAVTGEISFKVLMEANSYDFPIFKELNISMSL